PLIIQQIKEGAIANTYYPETILKSPFITALFPNNQWEPQSYDSFEEAYHQLVWGLTRIQVASLQLARGKSPISKVFIDRGFVHNAVFIQLLTQFLEGYTLEFS